MWVIELDATNATESPKSLEQNRHIHHVISVSHCEVGDSAISSLQMPLTTLLRSYLSMLFNPSVNSAKFACGLACIPCWTFALLPRNPEMIADSQTLPTFIDRAPVLGLRAKQVAGLLKDSWQTEIQIGHWFRTVIIAAANSKHDQSQFQHYRH